MIDSEEYVCWTQEVLSMLGCLAALAVMLLGLALIGGVATRLYCWIAGVCG